MSRKRNDAFAEATVGVFMIAVLSLLVYFTIVISGVDVLMGREKVTALVSFDSVGGLKDHDSVMYRGTKVGAVEEVVVGPSNLLVRIEIDRSVVLREGYKIAVCNLSMLGGNYLVLEEGEGAVIDIASAQLKGETPTDWMRDVSEIARNLKEITGRIEIESIITNIEAASVSAKVIAQRLERGEGSLGRLLSADDTLYRDVSAAVADAKKTLADASEITARVNRGEGTVGRLLSADDTLYAELKESVAAFKKACDQVKLPENMDREIAEITAGANRLMTNLNVVAERLRNGEGTLGRLTADQKLYDDVQGIIKDVRQVLDNYRDTTPISTFGSLIMGGL
jgi:phospholipid/cholesterol/gamma-HCH transport system substrate-binding protein